MRLHIISWLFNKLEMGKMLSFSLALCPGSFMANPLQSNGHRAGGTILPTVLCDLTSATAKSSTNDVAKIYVFRLNMCESESNYNLVRIRDMRDIRSFDHNSSIMIIIYLFIFIRRRKRERTNEMCVGGRCNTHAHTLFHAHRHFNVDLLVSHKSQEK